MSGIFSAGGAGNVGVSGFYPVTINDSLRFEDGSSAYLNRTPSSAGNLTTWTWSAWVKRGNISQSSNMFIAYSGANDFEYIRFDSDDTLRYTFYVSGSVQNLLSTSGKFRDTSSWYHILVQRSGSSSEIYVNGIQQALNTGTRVSGNGYFNSTNAHNIGRFTSGSQYFDGYMADINFIDGQALDPTSFGEAKDGTWIPKSYSGSYGTNGFHLEFNGNTNDTSGNGNNWTANNISAHDYVPDSPTNNFAVLNALDLASGFSLSEGNLQIATTTSGNRSSFGNFIPASGKWYFEANVTVLSVIANFANFGVAPEASLPSTNPQGSSGGVSFQDGGRLFFNGSETNDWLADWAVGSILQCAFDADTGKVWLGRNNTYGGSGDPASGSNEAGTISGKIKPLFGQSSGDPRSATLIYNFGQDSTFAGNTTAGGNSDANGKGDFKYAPPSGYLALCSANLPEPTIIDGSEYFNTVLYTGTGTTDQAVTGVGFQPDFTWIKSRSDTFAHWLNDSVRGAGKGLRSEATDEEYTTLPIFLSFDTDGFTVDVDTATANNTTNGSGSTFAAWNWKAGGTAVSNTDGSITSQVSANVDAGFSVFATTSNPTDTLQTYGHGLNQAPELVFIKTLDSSQGWLTYHKDNGFDKYMFLNSPTGATSLTDAFANVTDTVVQTRYFAAQSDIVGYCFHSVDGYSKVGSYIGGGSNFPFVFTGFRPAWVMIKASSTTGNWFIVDTARDPFNPTDDRLYPNLSNVESDFTSLDSVSNGFKVRNSFSDMNTSGQTYIFLAFAETPFKYSNAR